MKKTFPRLLFLGIGFSFLITSCGEDSDPKSVPVAEGPQIGFLCTVGLSRSGASDTLVYWATSSNGEMRGYLKGEQENDERIILTPLAGGIASLARTIPYTSPGGDEYKYFGFYFINSNYAGYPPGYDYKYTLRTSFTADCEFVLSKAKDKPGHFYLESKLYPGYYLSPERWKSASYPTETDLVLGNTKQAFFILLE